MTEVCLILIDYSKSVCLHAWPGSNMAYLGQKSRVCSNRKVSIMTKSLFSCCGWILCERCWPNRHNEAQSSLSLHPPTPDWWSFESVAYQVCLKNKKIVLHFLCMSNLLLKGRIPTSQSENVAFWVAVRILYCLSNRKLTCALTSMKCTSGDSGIEYLKSELENLGHMKVINSGQRLGCFQQSSIPTKNHIISQPPVVIHINTGTYKRQFKPAW